jgi:hypothetical protein
MPASGNNTEAELEQRQQAAVTHGAYAFQHRGEVALEPAGRTRLAEIREQVQDRQGLIDLLEERTAQAVLTCELVESHIVEEVHNGKRITEIPALAKLPAFWNSAQRHLSTLLGVKADTDPALDITDLLQGAKHDAKA